MKSPLEKILKHVGGQTALAKMLGVKQQHVYGWLHRSSGLVPPEYVMTIENLTSIPCWEIRPDLYPPERFNGGKDGTPLNIVVMARHDP